MNIRDFNRQNYEARKQYVLDVTEKIQARYPRAKIEVKLVDVYNNIIDSVGDDRWPIDLLYQAAGKLEITPNTIAMRGGTDGSALSVKGLLTPNYFTGGLNFHSNAEFLPLPSLHKSLEMTLTVLDLATKRCK